MSDSNGARRTTSADLADGCQYYQRGFRRSRGRRVVGRGLDDVSVEEALDQVVDAPLAVPCRQQVDRPRHIQTGIPF